MHRIENTNEHILFCCVLQFAVCFNAQCRGREEFSSFFFKNRLLWSPLSTRSGSLSRQFRSFIYVSLSCTSFISIWFPAHGCVTLFVSVIYSYSTMRMPFIYPTQKQHHICTFWSIRKRCNLFCIACLTESFLVGYGGVTYVVRWWLNRVAHLFRIPLYMHLTVYELYAVKCAHFISIWVFDYGSHIYSILFFNQFYLKI